MSSEGFGAIQMNVSKNGILVENRPRDRREKVKHKPQITHYKLFVTLTRIEDGHIVWLSTPFIKKDLVKLKKDGWWVREVWRPEEPRKD